MIRLQKETPLAVLVSQDVLDMHHELEMLREENAELREYRDKYFTLLRGSIEHSERMMGGMLELALDRAELLGTRAPAASQEQP